MKDLSIGKKFTLINVVVTLLVLVIGYFILNKYKNNLTNEVYDDVKVELNTLSKAKIEANLPARFRTLSSPSHF
jgi:methyl-accepting chemotaxis protein